MSSTVSYPVWQPSQQELEHSQIARFMKMLGIASYDDFYRFSIEQPEAYWKAFIEFSGMVFSQPYHQFVDLSRGKAFPRWFVGGEMNWIDTCQRWADHPKTRDQAAIIAVRESGSVQQVSFAEFFHRVRKFAAGLKKFGIQKGDRIGLLMENGIEANVSFFAISYIGAVVVPLFSGFGVDAIVSRLESCQARLLLATTGFARRGKFIEARSHVNAAREKLPSIEAVFFKVSAEGPALSPGERDWNELASAEPLQEWPERMDPNDPFMVIYTSGTTGKPKGPVHTHGGFPIKMAHDAMMHFNLDQGDVFCWPADMGWIAGPMISSSAMLMGATLVTYDGTPDYPDWSRMARLIETYKVTHYGASPTLIRGAQAHAADAVVGDLSSIRLLISAGEAINQEHYHWFHQNFGALKCPVINITGGTEVSSALLANVVIRPIAPAGFNSKSPGVNVDIVDLNGNTVRNQIGEMAIREPFVGMCSSFWRDDERYLETYWETVPGIWIHGDLVLWDDKGFFYVLGRSDDTIKLAGKRLGPAEVEKIVLEMPQFTEAAAVGVEDSLKGARLIVLVIVDPKAKEDAEQLKKMIKDRVEENIGKPFRPSEVFMVKMLPKTRSTKVMRRVIRNVYTGSPLGDLSALDNPAALEELKSVFAG